MKPPSVSSGPVHFPHQFRVLSLPALRTWSSPVSHAAAPSAVQKERRTLLSDYIYRIKQETDLTNLK